MEKRGFGELELLVLKTVQELGRATVHDVYKKLGKKGSYTTIMTVMSRMAGKDELMREKKGKQYVYWTTSRNKASSKNILKRIQDKIFGGNPIKIVSYLLETDQDISNKELEEIEKLIQKRKSENERHE